MARPVSIHIAVGQRFGKLVVESFAGSKSRQRHWNCRCDCGNTKVISSGNLDQGTSSCGCLRAEVNREVRTTHGMSKHPLHGVWNTMITRCHNPNAIKFKRYGARGISVCEEWRTSAATFMAWAMANGWQPGLQIDRIDNDGNYEPQNCRFVTRSENIRNRPYTRRISAFGETKTLVEWCDDPRCRVNRLTLRARIIEGVPPELAITLSPMPRVPLDERTKTNG